MNLKAMMFAGLGLFIAMTATAIWVGNDMAAIKERERAKRAAECAALATPAQGAAGTAVAPVTATPTAAGATTAAAPKCPAPSGGTNGAIPTTDPGGVAGAPATEPTIDPTTGLPIEQPVDPASDPSMGSGDGPTTAPVEEPLPRGDAMTEAEAATAPGEPAPDAWSSEQPEEQTTAGF